MEGDSGLGCPRSGPAFGRVRCRSLPWLVDDEVGALDGRINTRASGQVADHDVARRSAAAQDANVQAARNQSRHNEAAQCA